MTTTVDLLAAIGALLAEFELPAIASLHVTAAMSAPQVTVHRTCHEPSAIARGLLAWADTLIEVTAQAWRVPQGDSVRLSVTGLLPCGASILVYGGQWANPRSLSGDLPLDAATTIPLPMLRHAATVEETRA
ncbi:MAG: hypothetical protein LC808_14045 [Actinobacteria bacterium]|nr:hypothetical protein [Actinomycetota bacterium]